MYVVLCNRLLIHQVEMFPLSLVCCRVGIVTTYGVITFVLALSCVVCAL